MISYTVEQAAEQVYVTVATIEEWITAGYLVAVRSGIDGHRYVEETALLEVEWAVRTRRDVPIVAPGPLTLPELRQWLWDHGHPVTGRALEDWVYGQRILTAVVPGRRGRGGAARFDPIAALRIALDPRYAPTAANKRWALDHRVCAQTGRMD